ncbi:TPA: pertactin-like passenger domain-containing protein, partial [Serratia fonticola]
NYTINSIGSAITVSNGGHLTLDHDTNLTSNSPFGKGLYITGDNSAVDINKLLGINLRDNSDVSGVVIEERATLNVNADGRIVINSSNIGSMGAGPRGVSASGGATVNLGRNASITTGNPGSDLSNSFGIVLNHGASALQDTAITAEDIHIVTTGPSSSGIQVWNLSSLTTPDTKSGIVKLTGKENRIETSGKGAVGLATGYTRHGLSQIIVGDITNPATINISTRGESAVGLYTELNGIIELTGNNNQITTTGNQAHGAMTTNGTVDSSAQKATLRIIGNDQAISTSGNDAHGLFSYQGGDITLENGGTHGSITVTGENSHAVAVDGFAYSTTSNRISTITLAQSGGTISSTKGDIFNAKGGIIDASLDNVQVGSNGYLISSTTTDGGHVGSWVSVTATSGSQLTGDVYADANSTAQLRLDSAAAWYGKANNADITTHNGGLWTLSDNSSVKQLINDGITQFYQVSDTLSPRSSSLYRTLTVDELSGNGRFMMRADMGNGVSDKLLVTGTTAGNYQINVLSDGSQNTMGTEQLTMIETASGDGNFSLENSKVDLGGYSYVLQRETNGQNWQLTAGPTPEPS